MKKPERKNEVNIIVKTGSVKDFFAGGGKRLVYYSWQSNIMHYAFLI